APPPVQTPSSQEPPSQSVSSVQASPASVPPLQTPRSPASVMAVAKTRLRTKPEPRARSMTDPNAISFPPSPPGLSGSSPTKQNASSSPVRHVSGSTTNAPDPRAAVA